MSDRFVVIDGVNIVDLQTVGSIAKATEYCVDAEVVARALNMLNAVEPGFLTGFAARKHELDSKKKS